MMDEEGPLAEVRPAPGKLRGKPNAERVAARVAAFLDEVATPLPRRGLVGKKEVVTPLNAGFFQLERLRTAGVAKKRKKVRAKVRGK